jgi:hypothetical protein
MVVRVHDAADKKVINERNSRLDPLITFRGIFDALELDRPQLEVNVCMDCTFGSILAALLPCLHFQLHPLQQPQLLINRLQCAKAQFYWLSAPVPVTSLPASFIQQAPSGQEGKVLTAYEQLYSY